MSAQCIHVLEERGRISVVTEDNYRVKARSFPKV